MEPPAKNQATPGEQPSENSPLKPGTIIKPQTANLEVAPSAKPTVKNPKPELPKSAAPAIVAKPLASPISKPMPTAIHETAPPPTPPAPAPPKSVPTAAPPTPAPTPPPVIDPNNLALNQSPKPKKTIEPEIASVPVVPAPPAAESVLAMKPADEKLITRPHLENRPPETKVVAPLSGLKKSSSDTHTEIKPATSKPVPVPHKTKNIYDQMPKTLLVAVTFAIILAVYCLVRPLETTSPNVTHLLQAAAVVSIFCCIGLLRRLNWARSVYVTINIAAIVLQIFIIYQIRHTAVPQPSTTAAKSDTSITGYVNKTEQWLDPTYHQADQRIAIIIGELAVIYLLTTPFMEKVFDRRS